MTRYELKYTVDGTTWLEHYQDDDSTVMVRQYVVMQTAEMTSLHVVALFM